jgi:hypothetical protein
MSAKGSPSFCILMQPSGQKTEQTPHFTHFAKSQIGRLDRQSPVRLYREEPGSVIAMPMAKSLQLGVPDCLDTLTSSNLHMRILHTHV